MSRRALAALFTLGLLIPTVLPCGADCALSVPRVRVASRPAKDRRDDAPPCCRFKPVAATAVPSAPSAPVAALFLAPVAVSHALRPERVFAAVPGVWPQAPPGGVAGRSPPSGAV
jgi:hypothetical protein